MIRLAVRVASERAELVLAELLELLPGGVEEVDLGAGLVEFAAYGAPGELPALPALEAAAAGALVEVTTREVPDDWDERWRAFHRPVTIEAPSSRSGVPQLPTFRIRPPWEPPAGEAIEEIAIDPGQAFGTGAHPTTRLCLELLLELAADGDRGALIDIGTGSGVLAIAAARLGYAPVLAIDNDPASVDAARTNALANAVAVDVLRHDLRSGPPPPLESPPRPLAAASPPVITANLLRPLLLELAVALTDTPSALIAGGILREEIDEVAGAFSDRLALRERDRRHSGEWSAVLLVAS